MGPERRRHQRIFPALRTQEKPFPGQSDQVTADLNATADYAKKIPASNGKLAVQVSAGRRTVIRLATNRKGLERAFVFNGPGPANVSAITAPVYGFYCR